MTAALATSILTYLIQYGPVAVQVIEGIVAGVKDLTTGGAKPTDAQIQAMALGIMAAHNALPKPSV